MDSGAGCDLLEAFEAATDFFGAGTHVLPSVWLLAVVASAALLALLHLFLEHRYGLLAQALREE